MQEITVHGRNARLWAWSEGRDGGEHDSSDSESDSESEDDSETSEEGSTGDDGQETVEA
jgi:hypothetical protein